MKSNTEDLLATNNSGLACAYDHTLAEAMEYKILWRKQGKPEGMQALSSVAGP